MAEASARFGLPAIVAGQAQKEVTHNEALAILDIVVHPVVETLTLAVPPGDPRIGQSWAVPADGVGAWTRRQGQIACWTNGGWRFVMPTPGMTAWIVDAGQHAFWTGAAWSTGPLPTGGVAVGGLRVVGTRQPAILGPSGGETVDIQGRATLSAVLTALRNHGLITT
ncbi:DUF2793 domain-containing protein [Sphingomonas prati]|uniref:DUF2793 domain-containing protein n=1 Tax=Sphingomonas prati TaxID=1843237 RepID=A0A7W9BUW1_9SPHN|nr:DUF2793 domain-containing protein [Sphingomonas prati]MBB5730560.1 hypothetical protein [Sphingomonas prati]